MRKFLIKLKESSYAVLPITVTVITFGLIFGVFKTDGVFNAEMFAGFLIGAAMLVIGMALFTLGADIGMMPIGELMGQSLTKTKKLWLILVVSFITGVLITIAEPGLFLLAYQLTNGIVKDERILQLIIIMMVVGIGVGIFLLISMLKTIFNISLNKLLVIFYSGVFVIVVIMVILGKDPFLPVSFDSGGATTGAITVPFIMAFGIGIAAIKGGEESADSFGYIGLASIGPISAVMIWGLFTDPKVLNYEVSHEAFSLFKYVELDIFGNSFPVSLLFVFLPLAAIFLFFLVFQATLIKMPKKKVYNIVIGVIYTLFGLALFLTGANVGFGPAGKSLGEILGGHDTFSWALIPIGVLVGCFIVAAEPAIVILNQKVDEISGGTIKKRTMLIALMAAIGASIGLAMIRALYHVNILWMLVPVYVISLALSFFVPKVFTAVAFDSGGVASGPMTSAFLLPLAIGASIGATGGTENILTEAFGVIAFVAMTPLIAVQAVGLIARIKLARINRLAPVIAAATYSDYDIIELGD